ncbi:unnamed protein product [Anisakis simplex]|uniref:Uncharacterized protein n=1 Tax=Anisakis simplex TaxID=6269 RepID=A0A0M3JNB9_ANISI|nr:unnamed protein product [Anisakis simplex]
MTLTGDKLYSFAHEMLTNRRYKDAVVHIHDVYLDRIIDSLQEALFWTNRSLILSGRKATFQRKGIFMPSSQFFYVPQMFIVFIAVIALSE